MTSSWFIYSSEHYHCMRQIKKKEQNLLADAMKILIEVSGQINTLTAVSTGRHPGTNLIEGSVCPRAGVNLKGKRKKFATSPALETWTF